MAHRDGNSIGVVRCWTKIRLGQRLEANKLCLIEVSLGRLLSEYFAIDSVVVRGALFSSVGCLSEDSYLVLFSVTKVRC